MPCSLPLKTPPIRLLFLYPKSTSSGSLLRTWTRSKIARSRTTGRGPPRTPALFTLPGPDPPSSTDGHPRCHRAAPGSKGVLFVYRKPLGQVTSGPKSGTVIRVRKRKPLFKTGRGDSKRSTIFASLVASVSVAVLNTGSHDLRCRFRGAQERGQELQVQSKSRSKHQHRGLYVLALSPLRVQPEAPVPSTPPAVMTHRWMGAPDPYCPWDFSTGFASVVKQFKISEAQGIPEAMASLDSEWNRKIIDKAYKNSSVRRNERYQERSRSQ